MIWVICIFIILFVFAISSMIKNEKETNEQDKKDNTLFKISGSYMGGFDDITIKSTGGTSFIRVSNECISLFDGVKKLKWSDIKDVYIQSEKELSQRVTAGRLLIFGVFALTSGLQKKEVKFNNYIVFDYYFEQKSKIGSIIFQTDDGGRIVQYYNEDHRNNNNIEE